MGARAQIVQSPTPTDEELMCQLAAGRQDGTSGRAWLHRILMNAYFDAYRRRTREPETVVVEEVEEFYLYEKVAPRSDLAQDGNPEDVLDQIMDDEVRGSVESLPEQFLAAVILAILRDSPTRKWQRFAALRVHPPQPAETFRAGHGSEPEEAETPAKEGLSWSH